MQIKKLYYVLFLLMVCFIGCHDNQQTKEPIDDFSFQQIIYGKDNRLDYYQLRGKHVKDNSSKVAIVLEKSMLNKKDNGSYYIYPMFTFEQTHQLCINEKFKEQPTVGFCTAFAYNDSTIISAGHCIDKSLDMVFIFDFKMATKDSIVELSEENIFYPEKILYRRVNGTNDWGIIKTTKKIPSKRHVRLRKNGSPRIGSSTYIIGHPNGLPMKSAGAGTIVGKGRGIFIASLDSYAGNSGSLVLKIDSPTNTLLQCSFSKNEPRKFETSNHHLVYELFTDYYVVNN